MFCSNCGNQLTVDTKFCGKCGQKVLSKSAKTIAHTNTTPVAPAPTVNVSSVPSDPAAMLGLKFYSISPGRLFFLSLITAGIYEIYWFIKNWELIRRQQNLNIAPFWRGIFSVFFAYDLFKRILTSAKNNGYQTSIHPKTGLLTAWYVIASIFTFGAVKAESTSAEEVVAYFIFWIILFCLSLIPLLFIQNAINYNNSRVIENHQTNEPFTGKEVAVIVFGIIFLLFSLFGWLSEYSDYKNTYSSDQAPAATNNYPTMQDTQVEQTQEETETLDPVQEADYNEGYKAGYVDGRSYKGEFGDNYSAPATKERRVTYVLGYLEGFLIGCDEGGHDCSQVENYLREQLREDGYNTQLQ